MMIDRRWCLLACALAFAACGDDDETHQGGTSAMGGDGGANDGGAMGGSDGGTGGIGGMGGMGGGCVNALPNEMVAPAKLSDTGLYADIATRTIAPDVREFAPQFPLWSDGADKRRWVYLPECDIIDNADEDNWVFPVGTRMWKEFALGGTLLETRMIHRHGPGAYDFTYAAYQWDAGDADADLVDAAGIDDVKGTEHDIPSLDACTRCHGGNQSQKGGTTARYLGFGALQLSHAGPGVTMALLSDEGSLSAPNAVGYTVPGNAVEIAALGYLHSNCGNCHNDTSDGLIFPFMDMRIKAGDSDVALTDTYATVVNQPVDFFQGFGCTHRIAGMDLTNSCVHFRMTERGSDTVPNMAQMPPIGTDVQDDTGIAAIAAWIATLPPPN
jgi:cytochrome c553